MASAGKDNQKRADVLIVGGGPATFGLLSNAVRTNRLHELVVGGEGMAIVEQGLSFGGGCLQNFGINSNTSANGFIKCLYKKKVPLFAAPTNYLQPQPPKLTNNNSSVQPGNEVQTASKTDQAQSPQKAKKFKDMMNVGLDEGNDDSASDEEQTEDNNKGVNKKEIKTEYVALNPFKELYPDSNLVNAMKEFGPNIVPLSTVGMFMNYAGNHLLHFIYTIMKRRVFHPMTKVVQIQLLANGDVLTTAKRKDCVIKKNTATGHTVFSEQESTVTFRTKAIVLSNGGCQSLHPNFYKWFPALEQQKEKVILGDSFLKKDVFKANMDLIKKQQFKNIVIVGGSHSGFSCAWMLLNGPASYRQNTSVKLKNSSSFPKASIKTIVNCSECCTCAPAKKAKEPLCGCICKCFGFFSYKDWDFDYEGGMLDHLEKGNIKILYRDKIKVFYGQVKTAEFDGYTDFRQMNFSNKNGYLYSFTGLRGDAKKLYKQVVKGDEKRVQLVKAATPEEQRQHVEGADLVIWACGYQTNKIPIKDSEGKEISLSQKVPFTQYDIDNKCRMITSDNGLLTKTFGTGIAYPVRTNDGMVIPDSNKVNPRADSFSLYLNFVADRILQNLLPKSNISNKLHKTIRNSKIQSKAMGQKSNQSSQANQSTKSPQRNTQINKQRQPSKSLIQARASTASQHRFNNGSTAKKNNDSKANNLSAVDLKKSGSQTSVTNPAENKQSDTPKTDETNASLGAHHQDAAQEKNRQDSATLDYKEPTQQEEKMRDQTRNIQAQFKDSASQSKAAPQTVQMKSSKADALAQRKSNSQTPFQRKAKAFSIPRPTKQTNTHQKESLIQKRLDSSKPSIKPNHDNKASVSLKASHQQSNQAQKQNNINAETDDPSRSNRELSSAIEKRTTTGEVTTYPSSPEAIPLEQCDVYLKLENGQFEQKQKSFMQGKRSAQNAMSPKAQKEIPISTPKRSTAAKIMANPILEKKHIKYSTPGKNQSLHSKISPVQYATQNSASPVKNNKAKLSVNEELKSTNVIPLKLFQMPQQMSGRPQPNINQQIYCNQLNYLQSGVSQHAKQQISFWSPPKRQTQKISPSGIVKQHRDLHQAQTFYGTGSSNEHHLVKPNEGGLIISRQRQRNKPSQVMLSSK